MGKQLLEEVPKDCLKKHIVETVKNGFEYEDEWNFRRLMEAVTDIVPSCKDNVLQINCNSSDLGIIEVIEDYR